MLDWSQKRVLVTGAGGFIGSHLTEALVRAGAQTRALVRYNSSASWGFLDQSPHRDDIEVIAGDICDRDCVRKAVTDVDIVFHLAALIAIPYSYEVPASYVRTNVEGTLNVLQAVREVGAERVVHTSTSEVYGTAQYAPIDEAHPLQGQSPYAASKIGADKMAEAFNLSFEVPVVTVRPFNTYGPRQSLRAIIPTIITQCLSRDVVKLGSLHPTRDLNYVADTVAGFMSAAAAREAVGQTVNIGSGREISIGELAELIIRLVGRPLEIQCEDERIRPKGSEVERLLANNARADQVLGWKPAVSLEEGLNLTIDWVKANLERYRSGAYVL